MRICVDIWNARARLAAVRQPASAPQIEPEILRRRSLRIAPPVVMAERQIDPKRGFSRESIKFEFSRRWRP